jgi:hypothetical protein
VQANAQAETIRLRAQSVLDGESATQSLHCTGERREEPVAGGLEQPPAMGSRERLDDIDAQRSHTGQSGRLIGGDHGGVADHVGRHDTGQTAICLAHAGHGRAIGRRNQSATH